MPYYRAVYDGYVEGEYDFADQAKKDLMEAMERDVEDDGAMITVEQFNEKEQQWGSPKDNKEEK